MNEAENYGKAMQRPKSEHVFRRIQKGKMFQSAPLYIISCYKILF